MKTSTSHGLLRFRTSLDFYDVAMDDEAYNECFDEFVKLVADEGNRY